MPDFIRAIVPGGTFFFTVVTHKRQALFRLESARSALRNAMTAVAAHRPFVTDAMVLLPDHLHCIWTLADGDADFSTRWRKIKESFSREMRANGVEPLPVSPGKSRKGQRGYWQQRFWEHTVRDDDDYRSHADYIHHNPVKHGLADCPHAWPWSTFERWVRAGWYEPTWCCSCKGRQVVAPNLASLKTTVGE